MRTRILLLVGCLAAGTAGCRAKDTADAPPDPAVHGDAIRFPQNAPQLASLVVHPAGVEQSATTRLFGRLTWDDDVTVRVFTPFGGRVRRVLVDVGQPIARGTPLAEVESADFAEAQAEARTSESDERLASSNLARLRELYEHGAAPRKEVEAAEAEVERAVSQRARARARLTAYGASCDSVDGVFVLRSPIAGVLVQRSVTPGQEVRPDQMLANARELFAPLFVVSDPSRLWIVIDTPEDQLGCLGAGTPLRLASSAFPGRDFAGRVECVSGAVDPDTHTLTARGLVDNRSRLLKAEMFVGVDVRAPSARQVVVPAQAVILKGDRHFVFVEESPGSFKRREVQVGAEHDSRVLVSTGVRPGELVVTDGGILLQQLLD